MKTLIILVSLLLMVIAAGCANDQTLNNRIVLASSRLKRRPIPSQLHNKRPVATSRDLSSLPAPQTDCNQGARPHKGTD